MFCHSCVVNICCIYLYEHFKEVYFMFGSSVPAVVTTFCYSWTPVIIVSFPWCYIYTPVLIHIGFSCVSTMFESVEHRNEVYRYLGGNLAAGDGDEQKLGRSSPSTTDGGGAIFFLLSLWRLLTKVFLPIAKLTSKISLSGCFLVLASAGALGWEKRTICPWKWYRTDCSHTKMKRNPSFEQIVHKWHIDFMFT